MGKMGRHGIGKTKGQTLYTPFFHASDDAEHRHQKTYPSECAVKTRNMQTKLFRDFKRHFNKSRNVAEKLGQLGEFKFQLKFDGEKSVASNQTPDNNETMRFVVLMRRFLTPTSNLYFGKIWSTLTKEFSQEIPQALREKFEGGIEELRKGQLPIAINDRNITAENIYQIISEGGFFDNQEKARKYLNELSKTPLVGPLFWFQFYSYTLAAFALMSVLFQAILTVEKSDKYSAVYGEKISIEPKCIYCLCATGNFKSEEHIFPEALGNDELVLPKGYVCDKCNNEVLSQLDNALTKFEPIAFLQVQFVPYTKDGSLPKANFQNMSMERTSPTHIKISPKEKSGEIQNKMPIGDDWYSFSINMRGKPVTQKSIKVVGRALFKIALGIVALSQGRDQACSIKYDPARNFVLGISDFNNNFFIKLNGVPHPGGRISYKDFEEGTVVAIDIMGVLFLLNLEEKPVMVFNENIKSDEYNLYPLHG